VANAPSETTWKEVVRDALQELGGQGHLNDINRLVKNHPKTKTNPTWKDTIRRVVRQYTIFEPILPARSGLYRLVEQPIVDAEPESLGKGTAVDHGIAHAEGGSGESVGHLTRRTAKNDCATGLGSLIRSGSLIKG